MPRALRSFVAPTTVPLLVALGSSLVGCAGSDSHRAAYARAGDDAMAASEHERAAAAYERAVSAKEEGAAASDSTPPAELRDKRDRALAAWQKGLLAATSDTPDVDPRNPFGDPIPRLRGIMDLCAGVPCEATRAEAKARITTRLARVLPVLEELEESRPVDAVQAYRALMRFSAVLPIGQREAEVRMDRAQRKAIARLEERIERAPTTEEKRLFEAVLRRVRSESDGGGETVSVLVLPSLVVIGGACVSGDLRAARTGKGATVVLDGRGLRCDGTANSSNDSSERISGYDEIVVKDQPTITENCKSEGSWAFGGTTTETRADGRRVTTSIMHAPQRVCRTGVKENSHVERVPRYQTVTTKIDFESATLHGVLRAVDGTRTNALKAEFLARSIVVNGQQRGTDHPQRSRSVYASDLAAQAFAWAVNARRGAALADAEKALAGEDAVLTARALLQHVALGGRVPDGETTMGAFADRYFGFGAGVLEASVKGDVLPVNDGYGGALQARGDFADVERPIEDAAQRRLVHDSTRVRLSVELGYFGSMATNGGNSGSSFVLAPGLSWAQSFRGGTLGWDVSVGGQLGILAQDEAAFFPRFPVFTGPGIRGRHGSVYLLGSAAAEHVGGADGTLAMPWGVSGGGGVRAQLHATDQRALELQGFFENRFLRGDAPPADDVLYRSRAELRWKARTYDPSKRAYAFPWHVGVVGQGFHVGDPGTLRAMELAFSVGLGD